jgi:hypothetical protein
LQQQRRWAQLHIHHHKLECTARLLIVLPRRNIALVKLMWWSVQAGHLLLTANVVAAVDLSHMQQQVVHIVSKDINQHFTSAWLPHLLLSDPFLQTLIEHAAVMSPLLPEEASTSVSSQDADATCVVPRWHHSNEGGEPSLETNLGSSWHLTWEWVHQWLLPVSILVLGVGFSIAALYVAILPLL